MAQELDLQTKITVDSDSAVKSLSKFDSAINSIEKNLTSAGKRINNFGKNLSKVGRSFSLYVTTPIVAFSAVAVKSAGDMESIEIALRGLTGSAENAEKTMKSLTDFAAKTPFQFQDVANTARTLLSFGVAAENLEDTLRTLGDIAAGSGGSLREIGTIYGQVLAAGRLTGERFLQFAERGIPLGRELANVLGVQESALRDMISTGKVGIPQVEQALRNLTTGSGQFAGQLLLQSQSINGAISTLTDNISLFLASIGRGLADAFNIVDILNSVSGFIERLNKSFNELNPSTQRTIFLITGLVAAIGPLLVGIGSAVSVLGFMTIGIGALAASLPAAIAGITAFVTAVAPIAAVVGAITAVAVSIAGLINLFNQLRITGSTTGEALIKIFQLVGKATVNFLTIPLRTWIRLIGSAVKRLGSLVDFIPGSTETAAALKSFGSQIQGVSNSLKLNLGATVKEIDDQLKAIGSSTASAMSLGLIGGWDEVGKKIDEVTQKQKQFTEDSTTDAPKIEKQYTNFANNIASSFTSSFAEITEGTKTLSEGFRDSMRNIANYIRDAIIQALILRALSNAFPGLFQTTSTTAGGTTTTTGGISPTIGLADGGKVSGPGTSTSDSILAGLSNGEYVVKAASVKSLGTRVLDHINSFGRIPKFANGGQVGDSTLSAPNIGASGMRVVVENSGSPKQAASATFSEDAQGTVLNIILEDISRNGRVSRSMQSTFGLNRGGI